MKLKLLLILIATFSAAFFSSESFPDEECPGPDTSTLFFACASMKRANTIDAELNKIYNQLVGQYRKNGLNDSAQKLIEAERAWVKFKEAHCNFENVSVGSGSINSISWAECQEKITTDRLAYLKKYIEELNEIE